MAIKGNIQPIKISQIRKENTTIGISDDLIIVENPEKSPRFEVSRRLTCIVIVVCEKGYCTYKINQKPVVQKAGQVGILTEGQVVEDVKYSDDYQGFDMLLSYTFLYDVVKEAHDIGSYFLLARRHSYFSIEKSEMNMLKEYVGLILSRLKKKSLKARRDVIRLLMMAMLREFDATIQKILGADSKGSRNKRAEQIFVHYLQLVEHNYIEHRRVGWYAEKMGITAKYLSETVSNVSQHSPNDWIERYVTTEIRNQLRQSDKKISEIAEYMHFPNQSFLGKYFKDSVGISPSEYRNQGNRFEE